MIFRYACDRCREKHQSCDHKSPCLRCIKASVADLCHYTPKKSRSKSLPNGIRRAVHIPDMIPTQLRRSSPANNFDAHSSPPIEMTCMPHSFSTRHIPPFANVVATTATHTPQTVTHYHPQSLYPLGQCHALSLERNLCLQQEVLPPNMVPPLYQIADLQTGVVFLSPFPPCFPSRKYIPYFPTSNREKGNSQNVETAIAMTSPQRKRISTPPQVCLAETFFSPC